MFVRGPACTGCAVSLASRWAPQSRARLASRGAQMATAREARPGSPEPELGLRWDGPPRWPGGALSLRVLPASWRSLSCPGQSFPVVVTLLILALSLTSLQEPLFLCDLVSLRQGRQLSPQERHWLLSIRPGPFQHNPEYSRDGTIPSGFTTLGFSSPRVSYKMGRAAEATPSPSHKQCRGDNCIYCKTHLEHVKSPLSNFQDGSVVLESPSSCKLCTATPPSGPVCSTLSAVPQMPQAAPLTPLH